MAETTLRAAWVCAAMTAILVAPVALAEPRVYRCEEGGKVTYTDYPCSGAREVSINAGSAAPDARERLRRDQEALDVRATQRRDALMRQEIAEQAEANRARALAELQPPAAPEPDYYYPAYGGLYPYPSSVRPRRDFDRDRDRERERRRRQNVIPAQSPAHLPSPPTLVRPRH